MNSTIQTQYDALTTALDTLIDSITSYNPSPTAAQTLVSANAALDKSLEELATHQQNHNTLLDLRARSKGLDNMIRETLTLLADTRRELLAAAPPEPIDGPVSSTSDAAQPNKPLPGVDYQLLLSTAQRMAKYTVPPTYRPPMQQPAVHDSGVEDSLGDPSGAADNPPDGATPIPQTQGASSQEQRTAIDPATALATGYTPWPSQETIWRGAFARTQGIPAHAADQAPGDGKGDTSDGGKGVVNGDKPQVDTIRQEPARRPTIVESARALDAEEAAKRRQDQERMFGEFELYNPDDE